MRNTITRRAVALGAVVAVGLGLTACSSPGSDAVAAGSDYTGPPVQISFWNGWIGGDALTLVPKLIAEFNQTHKNIVVKDVPQQWDAIAQKMPLAIKAGKGPDIAVLHGDDIATYAAQGLLLKSDAIVKKLGYTAADFPPGVFDMDHYQGAQYGVPWSVTPLGLFINKDVAAKAGITEAPTDAAGYLKDLAALQSAGVQGEWVDGAFFAGTLEFESLLWQFGGELYNKDVSKATFNSEAGVTALTWMSDLIKKGYSPPNVAQDGNIKALQSGQTAYNWNGVWQTTNPGFAGLNWDTAPVPQVGTQKAVWSSSTHWVFPANKGQDANKTAAAAVFVKWMNERSAGWAATGELPADNAVRNDPATLQDHPKMKPFLAELEYAHYETVAPGIADANKFITTAVNEVVTGSKTPKQALDDAASQADQVLAQNRTKYGS